jgi:D-3-phosphoglycerate dehydrogenase
MKILITPKSFNNYQDKAYPLIKQKGYEIVANDLGHTLTEAELSKFAAEDVVGIIIGIDPLTAKVMAHYRNLRAISKYGVGMDNIDMDYAAKLGIKVKNGVGTNSVSVAELTIGLIFALCRRIPRAAGRIKDGRWEREIGCELTGKKLGLIGVGRIGQEVALRACGLQMDVSVYDPYYSNTDFLRNYPINRYDNIEDIYRNSDVISVHVPLTKETRRMINRASLRMMKPTAVFVNTARGELVDEADLYEALSNRLIAAAAQDVFSSEPPAWDEKLLKLDNFILTPHIGAFTKEAVERMVMVSTQNLLEMLES